MATFNLTTNFTSHSNRERVQIFKASAPNAPIIGGTLIKGPTHVGGHNWAFFNLIPQENYLYRWTQIDGSDNDILTYAFQNFTVPAYGSIKSKATQYLIADTTPGVMSGLNTIQMDGTSGTDDWRTWGIVWEKKGFGTEFPAIDYTYDIATGIVTLTNADGTPYEIQPGERFTVSFEDQTVGSAPVVVQGSFTGVKYVTANETILASDFGKNLIQIDGASAYLDVTLPPIASVPENTELIIKSGRGNHINGGIISQDANAIDWLEGSRSRFYFGVCESVKIYRQNKSGVNTWQVVDADGNFKLVGLIVSEFSPIGSRFNRVPATNALYDVYEHARLYEYVQSLTTGVEVVTFAAWATDTRKYSLANGSGKFHVPDLSNVYERATDGTLVPGTYQADMVGPLTGTYPIASNGSTGGSWVYGRGGSIIGTAPITVTGTGAETRPKSVIVRKYILC